MRDGEEHEIRCKNCGFLCGFGEIGGEIICHYCAIEREYVRRIFGEEDEPDTPSAITEWDKFVSDRRVQTSAYYSNSARENRLKDLLSFILKMKFNDPLKENSE
jgi:hypothetical protein